MYKYRASKGYTHDPCPGCGARPTDENLFWQRKKDSVCSECEAKLHRYDRIQEELKAREDVRVYRVEGMVHYLPYIDDHLPHEFGVDRPLQAAFHNLLLAASDDAGEFTEDAKAVIVPLDTRGAVFYRSPGYMPRYFRPRTAEAISKLFNVTEQALDATFKAGVERGRKFLADLAAGDLSLNAFEKEKGE